MLKADTFRGRLFIVFGIAISIIAVANLSRLAISPVLVNLRQKSYLSSLSGKGFTVPPGQNQPSETRNWGRTYSTIDLGTSSVIASDIKSNLLIYCTGTDHPADLADWKGEGMYLRSPEGTYRFVGNHPANLTADGHLIESPGEMGKRKLIIDGKESQFNPTQDMATAEEMRATVLGGNGKFISLRFSDSSNFAVFDLSGKTTKISHEVRPTDSMLVRGLRTAGALPGDGLGFAQWSMVMAANGDVYGQQWGSLDLYSTGTAGRLVKLSGDRFEPVQQLRNTNINTEMAFSPKGVFGLNAFIDYPLASRPLIFDGTTVTNLPIPDNFSYAQVLGVNSKLEAIIEGQSRGKHPSLYLWRGGRYIEINKLLSKKPTTPLIACRPYSIAGPSNYDLHGLSSRNTLLENGDILVISGVKPPHLILLHQE